MSGKDCLEEHREDGQLVVQSKPVGRMLLRTQ